MNTIKKIIKGFIKIILLLILIIIIGISFYITVRWIEFQKVYNSFGDWKLAHKIEGKLEKSAKEVRITKKPLFVNLNELTKDRHIDKMCIVGPYNRDINEAIGVNWKESKIWNRQIVNYDSLFSIILISGNDVVPIEIKRKNIIDYKIKSPCISPINNVILKLIEKNSNVYLEIVN